MCRLNATLLLIALICTSSVALTGQNAKVFVDPVHVGPGVHVSSDLSVDPHYEVEIAANPSDGQQLMACSMLFPNNFPSTDIVTYVSFDGGKTWKLTLRTKGEGPHPSWDPDCQYGTDNIAYSVSEGIRSFEGFRLTDPLSTYNRIDRSLDGGNTWEASFRLVHAERTFLTVDHNAGPQHGWLYLYGQAGVGSPLGVRISWSSDKGQTASTQYISLNDGKSCTGTGPGAILSDGTLIFPVPVQDVSQPEGSKTKYSIEIVRAKFQQVNWPLRVETLTPGDWFINHRSAGSVLPAMAVDSSNGPFRDRVYSTWEEETADGSQIKLSFSSDKGKTWSRPRVINDDVPRQVRNDTKGLDDLHGIVAVNSQGVVGVMWLDRRGYAGNLGWTVRFRVSLDGGETFLPSVKASSIDFDPSRNKLVPLFPTRNDWFPNEALTTNELEIGAFTFSGGHTMGLAADADGKFHPLWVANPTGVPQLWTTDITVQAKAEKNGSTELANLKDASKLVRLGFTSRVYNRETHALDFDLQLENVSESKVGGPLKVRVLDIGSRVGSVTVKTGDRETIAEGSVLDFSSLFTGGILKRGDVTKPIHVRLNMRGIDPFSLSSFGYIPLAILTTKVLAGSIEPPKKLEGLEEEKEAASSGAAPRERNYP